MPSEKNRYYRLNGTGHLAYAEWFEAVDDEDATSQVAAKYPGEWSEVWLGNRLVARLTPKHFNEDDQGLQEAVGNRLSALARKIRPGEMPSS